MYLKKFLIHNINAIYFIKRHNVTYLVDKMTANSYIVRAFNEMSSTGTPQTPPTTETVEPGYDIILVGEQSNAAGFPDDNGY